MGVSSELAGETSPRQAKYGETLLVNRCGAGYVFVGRGTALIGRDILPSAVPVAVEPGTKLMVVQTAGDDATSKIAKGVIVEYHERGGRQFIRTPSRLLIGMRFIVGWDFAVHNPTIRHPEDREQAPAYANLAHLTS